MGARHIVKKPSVNVIIKEQFINKVKSTIRAQLVFNAVFPKDRSVKIFWDQKNVKY